MTTLPHHPRIATIVSAAAALVTVLALSACAPAAQLKARHPHAGSGAGSVGSVPTPKPTPLADPVSRIGTGCSGLESSAAITTAIGIGVPAVTPPTDLLTQVPFTQDGALTCNWSDNYSKDQLQASNHLVLWVLPDVPSASWTTAYPILVESGETKTSIITGDAYGWCNPGATSGTVCEIDTRVGTTWLSLEVESLSKSFATSDLGLAHFASLINPLVTAAGSATFVTEPKWNNPAATATPTTCDTALPDSTIDSIAGVSGVDSIGPDLSDQESIAEFWGAEANVGEVDCDLASADQANAFFVSIVPGGSWAWTLTTAADNSQSGYATFPSLGSKADTYTTQDGTTIHWVRGGNLCSISVTLATPAKQAAVAQALATALNGKISG